MAVELRPGQNYVGQSAPSGGPVSRVGRVGFGGSGSVGRVWWGVGLGQSGAVDIVTLQRHCARTWPGLEQSRLAEALDRVVAWYAERGLAPRLQLPARLPEASGAEAGTELLPEVAAWCDARGWGSEPWTLVMLRAAGPSGVGVGVPGVELRWSDRPDDDWLTLYHRAGAQLPDAARRVIAAAPAQYLSVRVDGGLAGIGRVAPAGEVAVLTAIEVAARCRRRGFGTLITETLAARGVRDGARFSALQVFADNTAAVALYRRLGFVADHRYRYRSPAS
ncbi:MAG: GNAT family N-acetyltransferase [Micropruina sp.]|uniref:GNAT family N-acetyltransferase n=1 Tax=Micropruina sp. TaxID=2737536 RepID=UPI0039E6FFF2